MFSLVSHKKKFYCLNVHDHGVVGIVSSLNKFVDFQFIIINAIFLIKLCTCLCYAVRGMMYYRKALMLQSYLERTASGG